MGQWNDRTTRWGAPQAGLGALCVWKGTAPVCMGKEARNRPPAIHQPLDCPGNASGLPARVDRLGSATVAHTMQLTALLQAAQSPDAAVRNQAEQTLNGLQQQQYAEVLVGLSAELADASKPVDARRLAGLILKNTLDAKEELRKVRAGAVHCDHMPNSNHLELGGRRGRAAACITLG